VTKIITDAELVAQYAQKAMEEPEKIITTRAPSDSEVLLPGGYLLPNGEVVTKAEVKELNGADEEAISKAGSTAKSINVLLQRGLVKLGDAEVSKEDLDSLLSGDRDAILLGIRKATFGKVLNVNIRCTSCSQDQTADIDLDEDVPVKRLNDPIADRVWETPTKRGVVKLALPNGITQKRLMDNIDKTSAEVNTMLLAGCILSVDGAPSIGAQTALSLGVADRTTIIDQIIERNPGPRLGEVKKVCKACGEDIPLPLSLLDLFRL
jgi:hypothetical protein